MHDHAQVLDAELSQEFADIGDFFFVVENVRDETFMFSAGTFCAAHSMQKLVARLNVVDVGKVGFHDVRHGRKIDCSGSRIRTHQDVVSTRRRMAEFIIIGDRRFAFLKRVDVGLMVGVMNADPLKA